VLVEDRKLPGLALALDAEAMRPRLAPFVAASAAERGLHIQLLKHAPGKRCVIEYRIANAEGAPRMIGKLYRKDRGQAVFENMRQLWQAATGTSFGMAEPLAYLPELGMVLQSCVPGKKLGDFLPEEDLSAAIKKVAVNLAALHGLAVSAGEKRGLDDHLLKYCHPGPEVLSAALPESAPRVENLLAGLREDKALAEAPLCPVHGDLNLAQIFIAKERAWFIDFDGFCLSHAALDLGNFLVTLQVHFAEQYETLSRTLLESYLKTRSPEMLTGLRTYQAFAYLRRAVICARAQAVPEWRQQARRLLESGNTILVAGSFLSPLNVSF
jgi:tRNA A-37 threonylcarbamoyl transferase component Bud32